MDHNCERCGKILEEKDTYRLIVIAEPIETSKTRSSLLIHTCENCWRDKFADFYRWAKSYLDTPKHNV